MWLSFPFSSPDGQAPTVFVFFDECEYLVQKQHLFHLQIKGFSTGVKPIWIPEPIGKRYFKGFSAQSHIQCSLFKWNIEQFENWSNIDYKLTRNFEYTSKFTVYIIVHKRTVPNVCRIFQRGVYPGFSLTNMIKQ